MGASFVKPAVAAAALLVLSSSGYGQEASAEPTLEERVTALEGQVASLDTRLAVSRTVDRGADIDRGPAASVARIEELERMIERLSADLQRIERQADTALREALQARREATAAERLARDAVNRPR